MRGLGGVALLLLLLVGGCEKLATRQKADFSQAAIVARVEELRADVEAVLGDEIGPITVHVSTPDTLAAILRDELETIYAGIEGGPRGEQLKKQCKVEAGAYSHALLGKVEVSEGHLHICPENFERMAKLSSSWGAIRSPSGLDIILIHEMVHVWQHHRHGLEKLRGKPKSLDELLARSSVLEGHAQFVARAVARRRKIAGAFDLSVRMQTEVPDSITDPAERAQAEVVQAASSFTYAAGLRLWDELVETLGEKAANERLYTSPPLTTEAVSRPGEYLHPSAAPDFDLARAMRSLKRYCDELQDDPATIQPLVRSALKAALAAGGAQAQRAVLGFRSGRAIASRSVIVSALQCQSQHAAETLVKAFRTDQEARVKLFRSKATSLKVLADEGVQIDGVAGRFMRLEISAQGRLIRMVRVWLVDGSVAVEVVVPNGSRAQTLRTTERLMQLLAKPSPWSAKRGDEAIATMRGQGLSHADWGVRWRAVRNLGRLLDTHAELEGPLVKALSDEHPSVRIAAMKAVAAKHAAALADDPDWEVRLEACRRMALDEDTPKKQRIATAVARLADPDVEVQLAACEMVQELDGEEEVPLETLERVLKSPDARLRRQGVRFAPYRESSLPGAADLVVAALDDEDAGVRAAAARRVGHYKSVAAQSVPVLIRMLKEPSLPIRTSALEGIKDLGRRASEAVPYVISLLDDKAVRNEAADALKAMKGHASAARERLARALGSDDREFAFKAAEALWNLNFDNNRLLPVIVETLRTGSKWDKGDAAEMLGHMGKLAHPHIPDLIKVLESSDSRRRGIAAEALGNLGPAAKAALPALRRLVEEERKKANPDASGEEPILGLGDGDGLLRKVERAIKSIEVE